MGTVFNEEREVKEAAKMREDIGGNEIARGLSMYALVSQLHAFLPILN